MVRAVVRAWRGSVPSCHRFSFCFFCAVQRTRYSWTGALCEAWAGLLIIHALVRDAYGRVGDEVGSGEETRRDPGAVVESRKATREDTRCRHLTRRAERITGKLSCAHLNRISGQRRNAYSYNIELRGYKTRCLLRLV